MLRFTLSTRIDEFHHASRGRQETVTVEAGAPLINTEKRAVSTVIERNFVESLPLNAGVSTRAPTNPGCRNSSAAKLPSVLLIVRLRP